MCFEISFFLFWAWRALYISVPQVNVEREWSTADCTRQHYQQRLPNEMDSNSIILWTIFLFSLNWNNESVFSKENKKNEIPSECVHLICILVKFGVDVHVDFLFELYCKLWWPKLMNLKSLGLVRITIATWSKELKCTCLNRYTRFN